MTDARHSRWTAAALLAPASAAVFAGSVAWASGHSPGAASAEPVAAQPASAQQVGLVAVDPAVAARRAALRRDVEKSTARVTALRKQVEALTAQVSELNRTGTTSRTGASRSTATRRTTTSGTTRSTTTRSTTTRSSGGGSTAPRSTTPRSSGSSGQSAPAPKTNTTTGGS